MPKILRDTQKDCGKPGCPNDYRIQVLARGDEMIEQERRTSEIGTKWTCRDGLTMSALEGTTDMPF
jgi:hypothetical protein